jgi:hypothetical protein
MKKLFVLVLSTLVKPLIHWLKERKKDNDFILILWVLIKVI